jgi:hypothetical protein
MQVFSDYPIGWKLVVGTLAFLATLLAGYLGIKESIILTANGTLTAIVVAKAYTDGQKIKVSNGNGTTTCPPTTAATTERDAG